MTRKKIWKKALATGCAGLLAAALLAGCSAAGSETGSSTDAKSSTLAESGSFSAENESESAAGSYVVSEMTLDTSDMFTERDLEGTYDESDAITISLNENSVAASDESVQIDGQTVTITEEGVYVFSGTLSDGQVIVDADDSAKVQIVLNGCDITCENSAAIYVKSADKVFLTLADGTTNTLTNTDAYETDGDEEIDAVIYAKDDLTINGTGALTIQAANGDGIDAKDDLKLVNATLSVEAANHAIDANDSIRINSGTYTLTAGKDGLHVSNDEDGEKGYLYIADGNFTISCESDGMDATGMIQIDGGKMDIAAGDDGLHSDAKLLINGGTITVSESYEGLEGYDIIINDGEIDITSDDDGINATSGNGGGMMGGFGQGGQGGFGQGGPGGFGQDDQTGSEQGGQNRPEKGARPDRGQMPQDGEMPENTELQDGEMPENMEPPQSGEMPESMEPPQGEEMLQDTESADLAAEASSEQEEAGITYTGDVDLAINGGVIRINAEGDGIDSNGTITITGGETYIDGPSNGGNGSMDVGDGYEATITGGIVVAAGADGMAETFGSDSTQGAILQSVDSTTGDVTLTDSDGNVIVSFSPTKTYSSVLISSPEIEQGETYTLTTGTTTTSIEMTELLYGQSQGMGGGMQGGRDMKNMQRQGDSARQ